MARRKCRGIIEFGHWKFFRHSDLEIRHLSVVEKPKLKE
jgi:hypothetical protein